MQDLLSARRLLSSLFDNLSLSRGVHYAREGRGRLTSAREVGAVVHLEAECKGSAPTPYVQTVEIELDAARRPADVDGDCSCPMHYNCKHVACVVLAWMVSSNAAAASQAVGPPAPTPLFTPPDAADWLRRFERTLARGSGKGAYSAGAGEIVLYRLRADGRALYADKGRLRKDGSVTGLKRLSPDISWARTGREAPGYLTSEDVEIFERLALLPPSDDYRGWRLRGTAGAQALEHSLATGRLRVHDGEEENADPEWLPHDDDRRLATGGPREATLELQSDAAGRVRWTARPRGGTGELLPVVPVTPPQYLDAAGRQLGALEFDAPAGTVATLLDMPDMSADGAPLVLAHVARHLRSAGMETLAARIPASLSPPLVRPEVRLKITRGAFQSAGVRRNDAQPRWIAELWFDYPQGFSLPCGDGLSDGIAWRNGSGGESLALRDRNAETEAREIFEKRAGCSIQSPARHGHQTHYRVDAQRGYAWPGDGSDRAWRDGATRLFDAAWQAGAIIDCDPAFPHPVRYVDDVYEALSDADTPPGWFDLELGVIVEGRRVPLAGPLAQWLQRTPDALARLGSGAGHATILLSTAEAGLLQLPAARVRQLLTPLLETLDAERIESSGGRLRLSRLEAAMLPASAGAPSSLTALRERLADFRGIASVAPAKGFAATLRPYQQAGLDWLQFLREYGLAGILADDMGLGKTVQTLAHLHLEKSSGRADLPSLVIAPTSVLPNWREEAARFAPDLSVLVLHGSARQAEYARVGEADLVLTTYPLLWRDLGQLEEQRFHLVVFDEAQFLKNARTQAHAAAAALQARHRLALTGTPIENNLAELWAHFNLLLPGFLGSSRQFSRLWRAPIERGGDGDHLEKLKRRIRPFVLRRTRSEVLSDLPDKTEIVRHVELEGAQRDLYESLRLSLDRKLRQAIAARGIAGSQIAILDALLKLRQACCDPRLVKTRTAQAAHAGSAKLEALREMLAELRAEGRRALVFSQFVSMLELIEPELPALGIRHVKLTGDTRDRETPVKIFQDGGADVFLISLRAGGTGLNLTAADTVIHYDPWWNPAVEAQATARAHRMGQDKAVFAFKLIARGTVEERIQELLVRKQALADALLGGGEAGGSLITEDDVRALLAPIE